MSELLALSMEEQPLVRQSCTHSSRAPCAPEPSLPRVSRAPRAQPRPCSLPGLALWVGTGPRAPLGSGRVPPAAAAAAVQHLQLQQLLRVAEGRVVQRAGRGQPRAGPVLGRDIVQAAETAVAGGRTGTGSRVHTQVEVHTCAHIWVHTGTWVRIQRYTHTGVHTRIITDTQVCTHTHGYTQGRHMHTCVHACAHTQAREHTTPVTDSTDHRFLPKFLGPGKGPAAHTGWGQSP